MCRVLGVICLVLVAACQLPAAKPVPQSYRLFDLSDDYVRFYDETPEMDTSARIATFKSEIAPLLPGFYNAQRSAEILGPLDKRIEDHLSGLLTCDDNICRSAMTFDG